MTFGKPKTITPPALPPRVPSVTEIPAKAMKAGEAERRRLRRGRTGTIFAGRRPLPAAMTAQAGLKTTLG